MLPTIRRVSIRSMVRFSSLPFTVIATRVSSDSALIRISLWVCWMGRKTPLTLLTNFFAVRSTFSLMEPAASSGSSTGSKSVLPRLGGVAGSACPDASPSAASLVSCRCPLADSRSASAGKPCALFSARTISFSCCRVLKSSSCGV